MTQVPQQDVSIRHDPRSPDEQATLYIARMDEEPLLWFFARGRRLIVGQAEHHCDLCGARGFSCDVFSCGLAGSVLDDVIVAWAKPSDKELDRLWKKFGVLSVTYYYDENDTVFLCQYGRF